MVRVSSLKIWSETNHGPSQRPERLFPIDGRRPKLGRRVQGRRFGVRLPKLRGSNAERVSPHCHFLETNV
jgi:hypothetical protein